MIVASISPFGRSGPLKHYRAYPLNIAHVSGQGYVLPLPSPDLERAPAMIGGNCTEYDPGQTAALAILSALYSRGITGKGQLIEVSQQEAVLSMLRVEAVIFANGGEVSTRMGPRTERLITMMFRCRDGDVVMVAPLEHQWEALMELIGNTEWFEERPSAAPRVRTENPDAMIERIGSWMKEHTREEICSRAQALSCPITPVNSSEDVVNSEQMNARGIFVEMEHPVAGRMKIPSAPYHFSKTPWALERAAPLLGEHNEKIYRERLGYNREQLRELQNRYEAIGDIRGPGLMIGIELVKNRKTKEMANDVCHAIIKESVNEGVIFGESKFKGMGNVLKIKPPLVIDESQADRVLEVFEKLLKKHILKR